MSYFDAVHERYLEDLCCQSHPPIRELDAGPSCAEHDPHKQELDRKSKDEYGKAD